MLFPNTLVISTIAFIPFISFTSARPNTAVTLDDRISYLICDPPPNNILALPCQASNGQPNGIFCSNEKIENDIGVYNSEACRTCKCATQRFRYSSGKLFANFQFQRLAQSVRFC